MITGTTFAVLMTNGKAPIIKERLNKSANYFKISFFRRNGILQGILTVPEVLLELREERDMMLAVPALSVLQKYCVTIFICKIVWKILIYFMHFCSFSYSGKVIIKGVSNIIRIGYGITIIQGFRGGVQLVHWKLLFLERIWFLSMCS